MRPAVVALRRCQPTSLRGRVRIFSCLDCPYRVLGEPKPDAVILSIVRTWHHQAREYRYMYWPSELTAPSVSLAIGDGAQQCVFGLSRIEPGVLYDYRNVRLDDARVRSFHRHRLGFLQLVEAQVLRSASR